MSFDYQDTNTYQNDTYSPQYSGSSIITKIIEKAEVPGYMLVVIIILCVFAIITLILSSYATYQVNKMKDNIKGSSSLYSK